MSLHDAEPNTSDSDEPSDLLQRPLTRSLVPFDSRQAISRSQARRHPVHLNNYGHVTLVNVYRPAQYNSSSASGSQGYLAMASSDDHDKPLLSNGYESDPKGMFHTTKDPRETTPETFLEQPADWFKPGRFFSIWAPLDLEIHDRKFILLDSKNTEGKGVRVMSLDRRELLQLANSSSVWRTTMALKCCRSSDHPGHSSSSQIAPAPSYARAAQQQQQQQQQQQHQQSKDKNDDLIRKLDEKFLHIHMDEHAHQDVSPGTFIFLEHTYNIPFVKYKCVDHGMLEDESLDDLRFHYIQYLVHSWRLGSKAKECFSGKR